MMLTPKQRYRQAIRKSVLLATRASRQFIKGEIEYIEGGFDEKCLIEAISRAYEAGRLDAKS